MHPICTYDVADYKFTGKERDPDMGIDDFGARFYRNTMARFYSPDWSASPEAVPYAKLGNPQSLNLYTYALSNPLSLRDPDGHEDEAPDQGASPGADPGTNNNSMTATPPVAQNTTQTVQNASGDTATIKTPVTNVTVTAAAANNCQAPFLCNQPVNNNTIGPPKQWRPAKQPSATSNYVAFLGCYGASVMHTISDEEDGQGWTAYGFINAGAILAIRSGAVFTPVGGTFVVTAGLMDLAAGVKANQECTAAIYH